MAKLAENCRYFVIQDGEKTTNKNGQVLVSFYIAKDLEISMTEDSM